MKPPSWLPDWKDETKYPNPAQTSRLDWAWEFLRRNPEYQQMWLKLIASNYDPAHVDRSLKDREAPVEQVFDRVRRRLKAHVGDYPLGTFRERFGILTVPPDPSEPKAKLRFAAQFIRCARKPLQRPGKPGWTYSVPTALQDHEVLVWFDLRWPIEDQLKSAKKLLTEQIKLEKLKGVPFRFRYRADLYARYLRLLDAQVAGATNKQVAKAIYPKLENTYPDREGEHGVRADRAAAERLRDNAWQIAAGGK